MQKRNRLTDLEHELMVARRKDRGERIVREFGMNMYTMRYLKWMTNRDLLHSTWNSTQCYVAACVGRAFERDWMHGIPLLFTLNCHNIVNQLYPNTK